VADIKIKTTVKDIKVFDRAADVGRHIKDATAHTKGAAESNDEQGAKNGSLSEYATDNATQKTRGAADMAAHGLKKNPVKQTTGNMDRARQHLDAAKGQLPSARKQTAAQARQTAQKAQRTATELKGKAEKTRHVAKKAQKSVQEAKKTLICTRQSVRQTAEAARKGVAAGSYAEKGIKQSAKVVKATGKESVKAARKGLKTAQYTARVAARTARQTAVAAKRAEQAARVAAKAAVRAGKTTTRVVIATIRAIIAAAKALISVIAAGGWIAVLVILIVCLVGLIAGSAFGILFTGEDMGDGNPSMREIIATINQEHQEEIDGIKANNPHDEVMLTGVRAPWREVLAVYAVRITTDAQSPLDAITLDERRQQMLKDTYGDMSSIEFRVEDRQFTEIVAVEQADGSIVEETETYTRRTLCITQVAKSADEMAETYGFTSRQRELLAELLDTRYASAWQSVLYGTHSGAGDIVEVAASQLGNVGGQPYWSWYGFNNRVEWCACFVSWCADQCGYIEAGVVPKFSWCDAGIDWFGDAGQYQPQGTGYIPQPGDIIFFDWGDGGYSDHVGIVESCDGTIVRTIEGNSNNAVRRQAYSTNSNSILGYGVLQQ
jgi:hypothetical protein